MRRVGQLAVIIIIPILFALLMNQEDYIKAFIAIVLGCVLGFVIVAFVVVSIRLEAEAGAIEKKNKP
ncbi:MAG TPA: hypothetical protein VII92_10145 [Anaerolineae bacterium]